jgi:D-sedoheptulose 7-phosphate isomerase
MNKSSHDRAMLFTPSAGTATERIGYADAIVEALNQRRWALDSALERLTTQAALLLNVAALLIDTLRSGHKVMVAGNGGSAAQAQHFVAELVGRFKRERAAYAALALTTDTSIMTAVANDYGYSNIFARQVLALGQPGDTFVAYSTSEESESVLYAARTARERVMSVVAITGEHASCLGALADLTIRVPTTDTALAQELHMTITHVLCDVVETQLLAFEGDVEQ